MRDTIAILDDDLDRIAVMEPVFRGNFPQATSQLVKSPERRDHALLDTVADAFVVNDLQVLVASGLLVSRWARRSSEQPAGDSNSRDLPATPAGAWRH